MLIFFELVGLEKEGLSFVAVKADTKLKTKIVRGTIFTTRPEGETTIGTIKSIAKLCLFLYVRKPRALRVVQKNR